MYNRSPGLEGAVPGFAALQRVEAGGGGALTPVWLGEQLLVAMATQRRRLLLFRYTAAEVS